MRLSKDGQLFLNFDEMRAIQKYFKKQRRNPTDCELETVAQTWSEHCYHKTFRGKIHYTKKLRNNLKTKNQKLKTIKINNLLKSTIMKVTKELKKPWCVSVFKDNAGVIKFDDNFNVCFKVETHNHPSALEPFGGANTGIGGVIRDPLGTGLGARPIFNTDVFCFGRPDYPFSKLPQGTLHPKRVMKGVVAGVRDYGNKMGIPTINGAVLFDDGYVGNPLVYCGTAGIIPKDKCFKQANVKDAVVVVGGRTGRDGIHGATFSSGELTHESEKVSSGAVQIGNPIQEKKMLDTILQARDKNLYSAITTAAPEGCRARSARWGRSLACVLTLIRCRLNTAGYPTMKYGSPSRRSAWCFLCRQKNVACLLEVFADENVEATVIGEFTDTKRLELYYQDTLVCDLDMGFLHEGIPLVEKKAVFTQRVYPEPKRAQANDLTKPLRNFLSHYNVCSKEWVIRQYDHEVQGASALKPLVGMVNDGPSDASIIRPLLDSHRGLIVANGINFRFGMIDPYWMAASCIDEALRQIIAVGGSLDEVAILDNFCWGNPDKPDRLGSMVRAAYGCYDSAKGFGAPFISGKDSLYNEFTVHGKSIAIPGTLLISAIAVMEDVRGAVSMYAKHAGDLIYAVGKTYDELGGSHYYETRGVIGNKVPKVNAGEAKKLFAALSRASRRGLVKAMHDCSEGGIGVAAAEMSFSGDLGMELFLSEAAFDASVKRSDTLLFSESNSRFIVEIGRRDQQEFEAMLKGLPFGLIGCLNEQKQFKVYGLDGKLCVKATLKELKDAWKKPLQW